MVCLVALAVGGYLIFIISGASGGSPMTSGGATVDQGDRVAFDSPHVNALAVPLALAAGWLLTDVWRVLGFFFYVTCHEIGHAAAAWLGGYWSFPVPAGVAIVSGKPSFFVSAAVAAAIAYGLWIAGTKRWYPLFVLFLALAAGQAYLSFVVDQAGWEQWMIFSGCAGEFILSAVIIMAFYHRLPDVLRWDFFRYPLMVAAAFTLMASAHFWMGVQSDPETMILGGDEISTSRRTSHDMVRLVRVSKWTARQVADRYATVYRASFAGVFAYYLWFLLIASTKRPKPPAPKPEPEDLPDPPNLSPR
ncbi:hypothetical protein ACFL2T_07155 [Elusimicrobiota bacterium]